jgi:integrase
LYCSVFIVIQYKYSSALGACMDDINKFLQFLTTEKGQRPRTILLNKKLIRKLLSDVYPLNPARLSLFINHMLESRKSPSYIKQHISIIRQWGECFQLKELQEYPYPKIHYKSNFIRATFADDEIIKFLSLPNPYKKTSEYKQTKKNYGIYYDRYEMWIMFYYLLFYHGFRTGEVAALQPFMLDWGRELIIITPDISKTKEYRLMPISKDVRQRLYDYVLRLKGDYLFPSFHTRTKEKGIMTVTAQGWEDFFKKQICRLEIVRSNLSPYSTRHSYATRQLDSGTSLVILMELLGHKNLNTTQKYVHLTLDSKRKAQDNDRLRRNSLKYFDRLKMAEEKFYETLNSFANTQAERKRMAQDLLKNYI